VDGKITFINREDGSVNFTRNWQDYKSGFGDPDGEFWLGLDCLHNITNAKTYGLVVDFSDFRGRSYQSRYRRFRIEPESANYRLRVRGYDISSSGGDDLTAHRFKSSNNKHFTTFDRDNDRKQYDNCYNDIHKGGWWYGGNCGTSNPTGLYLSGGMVNEKGIVWFRAKTSDYSFKTMKLSLTLSI